MAVIICWVNHVLHEIFKRKIYQNAEIQIFFDDPFRDFEMIRPQNPHYYMKYNGVYG